MKNMEYKISIYVNSSYNYEGEIGQDGLEGIKRALQDKSFEYIEIGPDNNDRTVIISKANINFIKIDKIREEQ